MIRSDDTTVGFFAGLLDEVRIWNVARSQAPDPGRLPDGS